jgi:hypothetical protein
MSDPQAIDELVRTLADRPDELHGDVTPSVLALIGHGVAGAKAVLPLLDDPDADLRRHAQRVVEGVVMHLQGWRPGLGYPDPHSGQDETDAVLASNGGYDADAPPERRREAIERWRRWLDERERADR